MGKKKKKDLMQSSSRRIKGKLNARRYLPLSANYGETWQRSNEMP
jgi:hypothetical protein